LIDVILVITNNNDLNMKTLKCDICEVTAEGETFETWMEALKPHYMEAHAELMKEKGALPPEKQKEAMDTWMKENKERFEAAE
jgi:hypothetical protein